MGFLRQSSVRHIRSDDGFVMFVFVDPIFDFLQEVFVTSPILYAFGTLTEAAC